METIKAESIIHAAWDQVFRGGDLIVDPWSSNLALVFNVEIGVQNFGYERDGNTHHPEWERDLFRSLVFVVTARHEVFLRKSPDHVSDRDIDKIPALEWVNTSNHDSCWRSDGLREIWETLMEAHRQCWDHVPEEHRQPMNSMHRHCSVNTGAFSRGLIQLARVQTESDPRRSGWRRLTAMKKVEFTLALAEEREPAHEAQ